MTAPINIHIDELVVPAASRRSASELAGAVTSELHALLSEHGLSGARSTQIDQISRIAIVEGHPSATGRLSAPGIADSIYHGITGSLTSGLGGER